MYVIFLYTFGCLGSEHTKTYITLEDIEHIIAHNISNEMVRKNINPSIHTKEGLQKIADCLNNYIVCNHPGIVPLNSELVSWAEHGVVIKYDSYTEKIIDISLNVYHLQYDPQSNNYDAAIKEIKQCNKHAKYLYYYLNIFLKKLQK